MIELTIRSETPQGFLAELNALAGVTSVGQAVLHARQAQGGGAAAPVTEQPASTTEATQPDPAAVEPAKASRGRGRPPKVETPAQTTAPAATAPGDSDGTISPQTEPAGDDPGEVPAQFKRTTEPKVDVPKDLDGLRALIQKVCQAKSPAITEAIIKKYGEKTSLIPVDKYPEVAAKLYEAMAAT